MPSECRKSRESCTIDASNLKNHDKEIICSLLKKMVGFEVSRVLYSTTNVLLLFSSSYFLAPILTTVY